jgi:VCBS repeat-containing protein
VARNLSITDRDAGEAAFNARTHTGKYGDLSIKATGRWDYAARKNQAVIQALGAGDWLIDTIEVSSVDGTTHDVFILIIGVNDAAEISGISSASVTEDVDPDGDNLLEVARNLSITDKDAGEAAFNARTHTGKYGDLSIEATGRWNYAARNNQAVIQALGAGDRLTDTIEVSSIDGTKHNVVISIEGASDAGSTGGEANGSGYITISWIAPVEREDGTAISMSEIAGYRVYYGVSQGDYTREVEITNSSTMNVTLSNLKPGTYYLVVTSVDQDGRESVFSQEVSKSI